MSDLFKNAVLSMQLGIEDFKYPNNGRYVSAIRNYYSGILLLAKEVLVRQVPRAKPDDIISARYKPIPDGKGFIKFVQGGQQTIDFNIIGERFKDFGLTIDQSALKELNKIRNQVEHLYTKKSDKAVLEAIAKTFPIAIELFSLMDEDPKKALGDSWSYILEEQEAYDKALEQCKKTLLPIKWISKTLASNILHCHVCDSNLVYQINPDNKEQNRAELACMACGENILDKELIIPYNLTKNLEYEAYTRAVEEGTEGPIFTCPDCGYNSYIDFENLCAFCGYKINDDIMGCNVCSAADFC